MNESSTPMDEESTSMDEESALDSNVPLFSAWSHYAATGEGSTLLVCMGYGRGEEQVREVWKRCFGPRGEFFFPGLEWAPGFSFPVYMQNYLPPTLQEICADIVAGDTPGGFHYSAMIHLNYS